MVCGPALLQGLVPPQVRGARLEPSKPQGWAKLGVECPHCPLPLQSPTTSLGP